MTGSSEVRHKSAVLPLEYSAYDFQGKLFLLPVLTAALVHII